MKEFYFIFLYLSIDESTWGGCSWDWDSSEEWEEDWNTHGHVNNTHLQTINVIAGTV